MIKLREEIDKSGYYPRTSLRCPNCSMPMYFYSMPKTCCGYCFCKIPDGKKLRHNVNYRIRWHRGGYDKDYKKTVGQNN